MQIGDVVNKKAPSFGTDVHVVGRPATMPGKVVYIHPQRRFYTLEFEVAGRKMQESYSFRN